MSASIIYHNPKNFHASELKGHPEIFATIHFDAPKVLGYLSIIIETKEDFANLINELTLFERMKNQEDSAQ